MAVFCEVCRASFRQADEAVRLRDLPRDRPKRAFLPHIRALYRAIRSFVPALPPGCRHRQGARSPPLRLSLRSVPPRSAAAESRRRPQPYSPACARRRGALPLRRYGVRRVLPLSPPSTPPPCRQGCALRALPQPRSLPRSAAESFCPFREGACTLSRPRTARRMRSTAPCSTRRSGTCSRNRRTACRR